MLSEASNPVSEPAEVPSAPLKIAPDTKENRT